MKTLQNKYNLVILFLIIFLNIQMSIAQNKDTEILEFATNFYNKTFNQDKVLKNYIILDVEENIKKYVFNFAEGGFVITTDNPPMYSILAFSEDNEFIVENNPFLKENETKILKVPLKGKNFYNSIRINPENTIPKNTENTVPPFMTDVWGGVNCYDENGNVTYNSNYYTPSHCSPGCVAVASSQVLHYYEWPIRGVGNNVFKDNYSGNLIRHKGFFDGTNYDWDNMLDQYMNVNTTLEERQAIGILMYHMGVALQMDYEPSGSTSNLTNVPFVLENFYRFSGHYENKSWSDFWPRLYESMQQHRPVPIAVEDTSNGNGHVMVAHGYTEINNDPYYYINWGWWNSYGMNGWYNLQGWDSNTSGYNLILGAIFDMLPEPHITSIIPNGNDNDFEVIWKVSDKLNWEEFTLQQKVDQGVWEDVATEISDTNYTITNPTGIVYQFRVKAKVDGSYYANSYSEVKIYAVSNWYNGYTSFEGSQYAYARQTPDYDLDFSGDYTFETWIRLQSNNQNGDVIIDQENVLGFTIEEVTSNDYSVMFKSHSTNVELHSNQSGGKLQKGQWHHVAVSKIGNNTKLFVDGIARDVYSGSSLNLTTSNAALNIGEKYRGYYSSWIIADFDQMRISSVGRYSTSFTPSQNNQFNVDTQTIAYFTFQDVHRVRLKDEAYNLSVIVNNQTDYITWHFEENIGSLSIEQLESLNDVLKVYPNPTKDFINITYTKNNTFGKNLSFQLYDINSRKVLTIKSNKNKRINLKNLPNGIYFLKVKGKEFTATKKIIKQ